jgi:hypothetical protein
MTLTWYRHFQRNGGLNQILRRQTSRFQDFHKVKMYKDKKINNNVKDIFVNV